MIEIIMRNILESSLIGSIGILLITILRKTIINKYTNTFIYYIWSVVILKMIIPFKLSIYISETVYNNFFNSSKFINNYKYTLIYTNNRNAYFLKIAFLLWLIGVIALTFYHIYNYINFTNKIRHLVYNITDNDINTLYAKLLHKLNIKQNISLKYCKGIGSPLGMGIFKPLILLPTNTYNIKELEWILKHELIHFKKYDLYYKIITLVTITIHWFNPLVYIMMRMMNYDCELACDETLLKNSNIESRKLYAMTFIKSLRFNKKDIFRTNIVTGFSNNKNILKGRVKNMLNLKTRKNGIVVGILVTAIALTSFFNIKTFAESNKTVSKPVINSAQTLTKDSNKSKVVYKGPAKDVPKEMITSDSIAKFIQQHPNMKIGILNVDK